MFGLGPWELALIFLVILLLFGAKRLPEMAQGIGKGIKEFKGSMDTESQPPEQRKPPKKNDDSKKS